MIDYRNSIEEICKVHGVTVTKDQVEEINTALNDLITDDVANMGISEADADAMISDNFWTYVREYLP